MMVVGLGFFIDSENEGAVFLRNVSELASHYTSSYARNLNDLED
jgi:hypothetical protein